MDWKHGYFAESGYTYGYYPETMPMRLRWAALIQGHTAPPSKFRYLDAGCGQGLNLILAAAAHPDSEFVGIDFLPEHIAHGKALAETCGLKNVTFIEGDFLELAEDPTLHGSFDYAVCHGISTWIAPEVKSALFTLIGRALRPGGVFYNSYNTFPGWLGTVPFQHLVLLEQRGKTGEKALDAARESFKALGECAPGMFNALPALESRIKVLEQQDRAYLVQEYNNHYWQPVFVSKMIDDLKYAKLTYLGTATLPEAYDNLFSKEVLQLLNKQGDPVVREQLRDYATNQSFRRDLYAKGRLSAWPGKLAELLGDFSISLNPAQSRPENDQPYVVHSGTGETRGDRKFYDSLMDRIAKDSDGVKVADLIRLRKNPNEAPSVLQAVSILLHGGWITPSSNLSDAMTTAGTSINRHLAAAVCAGAPYRYLSVPQLGGALPMRDTDWMMLDCRFRGIDPKNWLPEVVKILKRLNRGLMKGGEPVADESVRDEVLRESIEEFSKSRLPALSRAGAI